MLNAEEARGSLQKLDNFFPPFSNFVTTFSRPFLTTLDVLRQLSAIFVFVLFAMQYKVCLGCTKRYHLFLGGGLRKSHS
jgi:hypothetical protein